MISPRAILITCTLVFFSTQLITEVVAATKPPTATVTLKNYRFSPRKLVITKGTTVKWIDQQKFVTHDIDSDDGISFESPDLIQGDTFKHKFNTLGTFPYHCTFHGDVGGQGMAGTIVVQAPKKK